MSDVLSITGLNKSFGGVQATSNFGMSLTPGSIYGLIGPNGAGKTTIFNMITGIYKPTSGTIAFDGKDITGKEPHVIANMGIGRTFQNIRLFAQLSVLENVLIANHKQASYSFLEAVCKLGRFRKTDRLVRDEARELLVHVGLEEAENDQAGALPYGHQRKLEIARALALKPRLLLLDEPAAGMNAQESAELVGFVTNIKEQFDLTILMIEHHMDVVAGLCDHVTVLNFGNTIATGTADEVRNAPAVIDAYLGVEKAC